MQTAGVVNINTRRTVSGARPDPFRDFFGDDMMERFFGPQGPERRAATQRASATRRSAAWAPASSSTRRATS